MAKISNYPCGHQAKHQGPCCSPFPKTPGKIECFIRSQDTGFVSDSRHGAAIRVSPPCAQELRVQGCSSCRQSSSFLLEPSVSATCRGAIPQSWPGDKQVETVRSHKRNITEIQAAKITLQRLMFDPCSCFLELEPSPPWRRHTVFQTPPQLSCGGAIKLRMKTEISYTRGRKQSFGFVIFLFPHLFLLLVPPFSPHHLPPWQFHHPFQPEHCSALSKQVFYEQTPAQRNAGQHREKTLVNFN